MPWGVTRSIPSYDKEILKYPLPIGTPVHSVVIDATKVSIVDANQRTVVPAGTILTSSQSTALNAGANANQVMPYQGSGTIIGILARPVDILASATTGVEPAPAYYHLAVFATSQIVNFTTYAAALVTAFPTCKFE
jgi:hypothetical protein